MAQVETEAGAAAADAAADGADPQGAAASAISEEEVSALLEKGGHDAVRPYDLTTQRINRTQLPMLEIVSKSFADRMSVKL